MSMKSYRGHNGDVFGVAIYNDKLISAGYDRIIRIFKLDTCELIKKLVGHIDLIRSVDVYKDIRRPLIISGSWDRTIKVWDFNTGECLHTLTGHTNRIKSVLVCQLTQPLIALSGSDDTTMRAWDLTTGHQVAEYDGHAHSILSIAASLEDNPLGASGSTDTAISVWVLLSGVHLFTLKGHTSGVCALVFAKPSGDGYRPALFSASGDSSIRVWSMDTGDQLHVVKDHSFGIIALSLWQSTTVPYPYVMSCAQNGTFQIWDLHKLKLQKTMKTKTSNLICIAQSAGLDNVMAFGGSEGFLRVQRTEEIYNAADIIGSPASPSRRKQKTSHSRKSQRSISSKKIHLSTGSVVSRSNSIESADGSISFVSSSINDDELSQFSLDEMETNDTFDQSPKISKLIKSDETFEFVRVPSMNDSLPPSRMVSDEECDSKEVHYEPNSPATNPENEPIDENIKEIEEELSVCSFNARVIKDINSEIVKHPIHPDGMMPSEVAQPTVCLGEESLDDVSSVVTDIEYEPSVFQNTPHSNDDDQRRPFQKSNNPSGRNSRASSRGIQNNKFTDSINSLHDTSSKNFETPKKTGPRISSAKWRHRGKHNPTKPINKGYGVGSRLSELKKTTAAIHKRALPRIIEPSKPFILVTSLESEAYAPVPAPSKRPHHNLTQRRPPPVTVRHTKPSTIVSSPKALPALGPTSHNGYQAFNCDESLKTVPSDCAESVSSDFFEVISKPPSPINKKSRNRRR